MDTFSNPWIFGGGIGIAIILANGLIQALLNTIKKPNGDGREMGRVLQQISDLTVSVTRLEGKIDHQNTSIDNLKERVIKLEIMVKQKN